MLTRFKESVMLARRTRMNMVVEYDKDQALDTEVTIEGTFCVAGDSRKEFAEKMQALVNEYRI